MTGFNLPPGCEVHHIPGNRPEDQAYEKFHETIDKMLGESIGEQRADHFFNYIEAGDWEEVLVEYIDIAAGLAAAKAIIEGNYVRELEKEHEASNS